MIYLYKKKKRSKDFDGMGVGVEEREMIKVLNQLVSILTFTVNCSKILYKAMQKSECSSVCKVFQRMKQCYFNIILFANINGAFKNID